MQVFHFHRLLSPALHPPKRCRLLSVCYFLLVDSVSHCWRKQTVTFSALSFLVQVECCWHSQRLSLFSFVLFFAQRNFIFVVWDRPWASKALNRQTLHSCGHMETTLFITMLQVNRDESPSIQMRGLCSTEEREKKKLSIGGRSM